MEIQGLPGANLIRRGLEDLSCGKESIEALPVAIGAARPRRLGFQVPTVPSPEHRLYQLLVRANPSGAHSQYNALLRRLTSFERAAECAA